MSGEQSGDRIAGAVGHDLEADQRRRDPPGRVGADRDHLDLVGRRIGAAQAGDQGELGTFQERAGGDVADALGKAASSIFAVLQATQEMGERELQLVAAQERLVAPPRRFTAERL